MAADQRVVAVPGQRAVDLANEQEHSEAWGF